MTAFYDQARADLKKICDGLDHDNVAPIEAIEQLWALAWRLIEPHILMIAINNFPINTSHLSEFREHVRNSLKTFENDWSSVHNSTARLMGYKEALSDLIEAFHDLGHYMGREGMSDNPTVAIRDSIHSTLAELGLTFDEEGLA